MPRPEAGLATAMKEDDDRGAGAAPTVTEGRDGCAFALAPSIDEREAGSGQPGLRAALASTRAR